MSFVKNRVLITGASGLLGRAIKKAFSAQLQYWEVLGTAFSRANGDLIKLDLNQKSEVLKTVQNFKPHVIIHCAAERRPDVVEYQAAATYQLNVEATKTMCEAAVECSSWLLYISTDYVFDGKEPPYQVDAQPHPLNKYGLSKLQGEEIVKKNHAEFAILRVPILYGQIENLEESAVTILWKNIRNAVSCKMSDYERRYPTHTDDVASVILAMTERKVKGENMGGIFHWSGDENMTKYDMAIAMTSVFSLSPDHIIADKTVCTGAPRPYNAHLSSGRLENMGIKPKRTPFKQGIKAVLQPYVN